MDPIPTFLLKQVIPVLASTISQIINFSLSSGHMPTVLTSTLITLLLKKTGLDPDCLSNYRPISHLPLISKLIERTVTTQTVTRFTDNDLFVPVQSAYRSGHSTETALVRVFNILLLSVDRDNCSALVLFDLSASFDTVDHQMLLDRLSNQFGVSDGALDWFKSYFSDQSQFRQWCVINECVCHDRCSPGFCSWTSSLHIIQGSCIPNCMSPWCMLSLLRG